MRRIVTAFLLTFAVTFGARAADWPQWRGPERTGISQETGLLPTWPAEGPALRWKATDIGTGYSTPVISNGKVYLQTTHDNDEFALALDEKTGAKAWEVPIGKVWRNQGPQYPGTRSSPTVDGEFLYCLASDGDLTCLETADGKLKWKKHLRTDFGGAYGMWAY